MTLSKGDYHRLLRDPAQLQLFGIGRAWPHEHGVKRSLAQAGNERRRIGLLKREVDFGIRTAESADRRRYRGVERSRWGVAEAKRAGFAASRPSRRLCRPFSERGHFFDGLQKGFTCRRELRAMRDTMKQRRPDLGLQIFDLLAKRGLADADLGGGSREVTFLRDGEEIAYVA